MSHPGITLCLLAGISLAPQALSAQTKRATEIEIKLNAKLDQPEFQTTQGMVEAYDEAVKAYRVEVARIFEKLMKGLPPNESKALASSHRDWLRYFESMRNCVSYVYDAPGAIHRVTAMLDLKIILEDRLNEMCQMFQEWDTSQDPTNPEDVPGADAWCDGSPHERIVSSANDPLAPSPFERKYASDSLPTNGKKK